MSLVGQKAPEFKLPAVVGREFKDVSLSDFRGKWVVMFFYPLDFTFVCPTEITGFSDRLGEFEKLGAQVLAFSTDSKFSHLAWVNTPRNKGGLGDLKYPLVADFTKTASKNYGVLNEQMGIAYRGLFLIDPEGIIRYEVVHDLSVGRSVDETLRVIQAFQHTIKTGEVCPINWTPGKDTINPKQADKYFEKVK